MRFSCLLLAFLLAGCQHAPRAPEVDYSHASIAEMQAAMDAGALSSETLLLASLARIKSMDRGEAGLNAVTELNPEALVTARALDAERAARGPRGPLHGIPILLKDNIDSGDGMVTSAGSLALAEHRPVRAAHVVERLRDAGAVILGKANLSEWANFRGNRSTSGWSSRGGQTRNAHDPSRNPCGSSSGSAVAVAAGYVPLAIGTETNGSVICPAAANGVVGLKPTIGLVSRRGIVPIALSQDTAGPITRSVADAALALAVMGGSDALDSATADADAKRADYAGALDGATLRGIRIGVARRHFGFHRETDVLMERALEVMGNAGAEIIDPADIPTHGQFSSASFEVLLYEFRPHLEAYLADSGAPLSSLDALIAFNHEHAGAVMPWFGQELFERAAAKPGLDDPAYLEARDKARRLAGPEGIDAVMDALELDALVAPSNAPAWLTDPLLGDHFLGGSSSAAAVAGYPNITVPAGRVGGLPVGISFFGRAHDEARLLAIAHAFEAALGEP
jgi:amidase